MSWPEKKTRALTSRTQAGDQAADKNRLYDMPKAKNQGEFDHSTQTHFMIPTTIPVPVPSCPFLVVCGIRVTGLGNYWSPRQRCSGGDGQQTDWERKGETVKMRDSQESAVPAGTYRQL